MRTISVIIVTIKSGGDPAELTLPDRLYGLAQRVALDTAFSDNAAVDQYNGHAPVVNGVQLVVRVDITELRFDTDGAEGGQSVIAEMAALSGDQNDLHAQRLLGTCLGGQPQGLPYLDDRAVEAVCPLDGLHARPYVA